MQFLSLGFLCFITVFILLFHASKSNYYRQLLWTSANILFLASFFDSFESIVPWTMLFAGGFFVQRCISGKSYSLYLFAIAAILTFFCYVKKYVFVSFIPALPFVYAAVGLSYVVLRILHLCMERYYGTIERPLPLSSYFNYTTNFTALVSGPIQYYSDFERDFSDLGNYRLDDEELRDTFNRLFVGFIKVYGIAPILYDSVSRYLNLNSLMGVHGYNFIVFVAIFSVTSFVYIVYLYLNFSGYMDIVCAFARLCGIRMPENFNKPFKATNFIDFWTRWHITLGLWLKRYIFNPLLHFLISRYGSPSTTILMGILAYFITFVVLGLWHGSTIIFVYCGLYLGLGVSINKLYQDLSRKKLGKKRVKKLKANQFYVALCRGLTIASFTLTGFFLWVPSSATPLIFGKFFMLAFAASFVLIAVGFSFYALAEDICMRVAGKLMLNERCSMSVLKHLGSGVLFFFFVYSVISQCNNAPTFVYEAF